MFLTTAYYGIFFIKSFKKNGENRLQHFLIE